MSDATAPRSAATSARLLPTPRLARIADRPPVRRASAGCAQNPPSRTAMPHSAERASAARRLSRSSTVKATTPTWSAVSGNSSSTVTPGSASRPSTSSSRRPDSWRRHRSGSRASSSSSARASARTPDTIGVLALARALEELDALDPERWRRHESGLREELVEGLDALPGVTVLELFPDTTDHVGVVAFTVEDLDSRLAALALSAEWGIAVRDGGFCAHPALARLTGGRSAIRASLGVGSSRADVAALLGAVASLIASGPRGDYVRDAGGWRLRADDRPRPDWAGARTPDRGCGPRP